MRYWAYAMGEDYHTKVFISDKPTIQDLLDLTAQYFPLIPPKAILVSFENEHNQKYITISLKG